MKKSWFFLVFLVMVGSACRSRGQQIKFPREDMPPTEFHHEPATIVPWFYANRSARGLERQSDAPLSQQVGAGLGLLINSRLDKQWDGHRFFYYYIDFDASPQFIPGKTYPGEREWIFSSYPGIMFRTYTPVFFKMHYGFGLNLRFNQRFYDRWGLYGLVGLECFGLTLSTIFIGHPGQANWETEHRLGYMWVPVEWK